MSITFEYFFNYPKSLADLADDINTCLGCSLAPYQGRADDLFDRFLSMEFTLRSAERFVDEDDLVFEQYAYYLNFRTSAGGADARPIQLPAMLTVVYALHRWLGITGMLVYDMQHLLAQYEEREIPEHGRKLYDNVSQTPFVSFPDHLTQVTQRLPEAWQKQYS